MTTSTAAGPAFEGMNISCGMLAVAGAIHRAEWDNGFKFRTVDDLPPQGVCGTGLIDILAVSLAQGLLGRDGRIAGPEKRIRLTDRLSLTQQDVRGVQLAVAAIQERGQADAPGVPCFDGPARAGARRRGLRQLPGHRERPGPRASAGPARARRSRSSATRRWPGPGSSSCPGPTGRRPRPWPPGSPTSPWPRGRISRTSSSTPSNSSRIPEENNELPLCSTSSRPGRSFSTAPWGPSSWPAGFPRGRRRKLWNVERPASSRRSTPTTSRPERTSSRPTASRAAFSNWPATASEDRTLRAQPGRRPRLAREIAPAGRYVAGSIGPDGEVPQTPGRLARGATSPPLTPNRPAASPTAASTSCIVETQYDLREALAAVRGIAERLLDFPSSSP
ncbi:MAG: ASKHA domain-containing protein [Chromatiales bacterium]|nr:ASKHA domain-containing protein [Chromatiales bacterium]